MNDREITHPASSRWTALIGLGLTVLAAPLAPTAASPRDDKPIAKTTWDFEADQPGKIAKGFTAAVGTWEVVEDAGNHVLSQKAKNENPVYNVALIEGGRYGDLDLSVRLRSVAGEIDQGGGLVWRAKDAKNYYIARYNPLEHNFRVYKVVDGKRTQLQSAETPGDEEWHTLRVTMRGPKITCYLDGRKHLEAEDSTFPEPGLIGLWSKADAQTNFDDVIAAP
jgi:hypothetical protein